MGRAARTHSFWRVLWDTLWSLFQRLLAFVTTRRDQNAAESNNDEKVQVYIMLGQSNMLGMGHIAGKDKDGTLECAVYKKKLYQYLVDPSNPDQWKNSTTVRYVQVSEKGAGIKVQHNEWITVKGSTIGPELGISHFLEQHSPKKPLLLLKSCTGNRSLGWDLLPPGSKQYEYKDEIYAGYGETPDHWPKGTTPKPINWYGMYVRLFVCLCFFIVICVPANLAFWSIDDSSHYHMDDPMNLENISWQTIRYRRQECQSCIERSQHLLSRSL